MFSVFRDFPPAFTWKVLVQNLNYKLKTWHVLFVCFYVCLEYLMRKCLEKGISLL